MWSFLIGAIVGFALDKVLDFLWTRFKKYWVEERKEAIRKNYSQTVSSPEYIAFQNRLLKEYYGAENCIHIFDADYPVFVLQGSSQLKDPYEELNRRENLSLEDKKYPFKDSRYYKKYKRLIGATIMRPLMQGYMLEKFSFDGSNRINGLSAWVGTYEENVYTSHILEHEIYRIYQKYGKKDISDRKLAEIMTKEMPLRNGIHKGKTVHEVITTGCARASLLGVQMLIVFKDRTGEYKVLVIKRSQDVAARPGFIQFVPSGGFEVFENSDIHNKRELYENFSVKNALLREYVEELFGVKDFEYGQGGETINKVINFEQVKEIQNMIDEGTAKFAFLGSAVDLTGLRHELSFVLVVNDGRYCENIFQSNSESKKIERYSLQEVDEIEEWYKINPASAALWKLFKDSELYREIINQNTAR